MAALQRPGAVGAGPAAPERATKDEAPERAGSGGFSGQERGELDHCASVQTLCVVGGERRAHEFLARLHAQQADPDELALIVAALYGAALRGFSAVITKALRAAGAGVAP